MERVRSPIRRKLLFATLLPLTVAILLCWLIGSLLITDRVFRQAQLKVLSDLNSARRVYNDEVNHLGSIVKVAGLGPEMAVSLASGRFAPVEPLLQHLSRDEGLSFLNVIDATGVVRYRVSNPGTRGDDLSRDPVVAQALGGKSAGATQVYPDERLARENPALPARAVVEIRPTPRGRTVTGGSEKRGLLLVAAAPVRGVDGTVVGVLQAGMMLNGDSRLVDTVTRTVFDREGGGAATVFLGDVRIATNVRDATGNRAFGTLMSREVARVVLEQGERWSDRAFVLSDWFISAYEPLRDPEGAIVGALYVGMPEKPLLEMRRNLNIIFAGVLLLVSCIGIVLSGWISRRLAMPVRALAEAARRMAAGERVEPIRATGNDEIGLLADEFNQMAHEVTSLKETLEEKVARRTLELEEKSGQLLAAQRELAKSERLAGLGLLAAGVAHEINNPLAIIRGNAELLQGATPEGSEEREEVDAIVDETVRIGRIVANLRTFSRSGLKRISSFSLGELLDTILDQLGHQIPLEQYQVIRAYWGHDREVEGDGDQLRQVFTNLILNGLQAMPEGGELYLNLERCDGGERVCVTVRDQGCGITPQQMEKLFTPFFTTKARGTGLGLAVSYGIVQDHGGEIRVESSAGSGATFVVLLPLRQPLPQVSPEERL
jgi:two-component system NtrC family sensor kinase